MSNDAVEATVNEEQSDFISQLHQFSKAASAALAPFLESIQSRLGEAAPTLQTLARSAAYAQEVFDYWELHGAEALESSVGGYGLIVPFESMSFSDLVSLLESYRDRGEAEFVAGLETVYDEIFSAPDFLDQLAARWTSQPLMHSRMPILLEALVAHQMGMYAVSIPALIAQFEGLVAAATEHRGQMTTKLYVGNIEKIAGDDRLVATMFSSFVKRGLMAQFFHGGSVPPLSRHAILHGADSCYGTERNSRTAIFLLDNFAGLTRELVQNA